MSTNKGQTLVEVVVMAGILSILLAAVTQLVVGSMARNREVEGKAVATRLAQEGVEWIQAWRNGMGWGQFNDGLETLDSAGNPEICLYHTTNPIGSGQTIPTVLSEYACSIGTISHRVGGASNTSVPSFYRQVSFEKQAGGEYQYTMTVLWDDQTVEIQGRVYEWAR